MDDPLVSLLRICEKEKWEARLEGLPLNMGVTPPRTISTESYSHCGLAVPFCKSFLSPDFIPNSSHLPSPSTRGFAMAKGQRSPNLFCPGPESKYYWLLGSYGLCCNHPIFPMCLKVASDNMCTDGGCCVLIKLYLHKQASYRL